MKAALADKIGRSSSRISLPWVYGVLQIPVSNSLSEVLNALPTPMCWEIMKLRPPAYGRYLLPPHPPHVPLLEHPNISHTYHRIFFPPVHTFKSTREAYDTTEITHSEVIKIIPEELKTGYDKGGRWVVYSIWEMKNPPPGGWEMSGKGLGRDLLLCHGKYRLRASFHPPPAPPSLDHTTSVLHCCS